MELFPRLKKRKLLVRLREGRLFPRLRKPDETYVELNLPPLTFGAIWAKKKSQSSETDLF